MDSGPNPNQFELQREPGGGLPDANSCYTEYPNFHGNPRALHRGDIIRDLMVIEGISEAALNQFVTAVSHRPFKSAHGVRTGQTGHLYSEALADLFHLDGMARDEFLKIMAMPAIHTRAPIIAPPEAEHLMAFIYDAWPTRFQGKPAEARRVTIDPDAIMASSYRPLPAPDVASMPDRVAPLTLRRQTALELGHKSKVEPDTQRVTTPYTVMRDLMDIEGISESDMNRFITWSSDVRTTYRFADKLYSLGVAHPNVNLAAMADLFHLEGDARTEFLKMMNADSSYFIMDAPNLARHIQEAWPTRFQGEEAARNVTIDPQDILHSSFRPLPLSSLPEVTVRESPTTFAFRRQSAHELNWQFPHKAHTLEPPAPQWKARHKPAHLYQKSGYILRDLMAIEGISDDTLHALLSATSDFVTPAIYFQGPRITGKFHASVDLEPVADLLHLNGEARREFLTLFAKREPFFMNASEVQHLRAYIEEAWPTRYQGQESARDVLVELNNIQNTSFRPLGPDTIEHTPLTFRRESAEEMSRDKPDVCSTQYPPNRGLQKGVTLGNMVRDLMAIHGIGDSAYTQFMEWKFKHPLSAVGFRTGRQIPNPDYHEGIADLFRLTGEPRKEFLHVLEVGGVRDTTPIEHLKAHIIEQWPNRYQGDEMTRMATLDFHTMDVMFSPDHAAIPQRSYVIASRARSGESADVPIPGIRVKPAYQGSHTDAWNRPNSGDHGPSDL